ncbi:ABC transporter permease [Kutzneria buriramensis]|uniref:ABC-2 family transporter n=1 Tax=Kutzneria buriramensis TaxID=1045776 RepID=A0A3E0IAK8_9PSEU|nr:ABC transporter permease [Kutzneria buriramensis]REH55773.1 hypothetical protein BCF44_101799 [Kutzneria buriramensis]
MSWLTWRLQRSTIIAAVALIAVFAVVVPNLDLSSHLDSRAANGLFVLGPPAFATVVAVFWGAPLVAREYEHNTYKLVWSRDRSATRWLAVRVGQLLAPLVVLTIAVNLITRVLYDRIVAASQYPPSDVTPYDLWPPLQLTMVLAAFGLGILAGMVARSSVPAMGITLVVYAALRIGLGMFARPYLLPPLRYIGEGPPDGSMPVGFGYLDGAGHELSKSDAVTQCAATSPTGVQKCMGSNQIVRQYVDAQPPDRIQDLQLIEFGIYAAIAAVTLAAAWLVLRRRMVA